MSQSVVNAARSWLGTPFKHQGRLKGIGCDCLGLVIGIASGLNLVTKHGQLISQIDRRDYPQNIANKALEDVLDAQLVPLTDLEVGTLLLMEFDNYPQHLAIVCDNLNYGYGVIHADRSKGGVVEHGLSFKYLTKIKKIYQLTNEFRAPSAGEPQCQQ